MILVLLMLKTGRMPTMNPLPSLQNRTLARLRLRWWGMLALSGLVLAGGFSFLVSTWPGNAAGRYAVRWLALSAVVLSYQLWVLWRGLPANHRFSEPDLLPDLGPGNSLTLARGVLVACLAGFLLLPPPPGWLAWIPAILYFLADVSDLLDGYLARRSHHVTRLGEMLDMSFDGLGVLVAALLALRYGQVPAWYLSIALARYLFLGGLWLRRRRGLPVYDLPPSISRRLFAGLQMGFIAFVLLPVFSPPSTFIAAGLFAIPFLVGFLRDWLLVSGAPVIRATALGQLMRSLQRWGPVGLRILVVALAAGPASQRFLDFSQQAAFYTAQGFPAPNLLVGLQGAAEALVVLLVLFGAGGRAAAVLGLSLAAINQAIAGPTLTQTVLMAAYAAILFAGTGPLSLWTPEDKLIFRRLGESQES
jgi:CDP-diacylglycerol--glycerol-3-phosphate 3-phosphatidyltransferase